jgi:hypothetical protein
MVTAPCELLTKGWFDPLSSVRTEIESPVGPLPVRSKPAAMTNQEKIAFVRLAGTVLE